MAKKKVDELAKSKGSTAYRTKKERERRDPCNNPELANTPMCQRKNAKPRKNGAGQIKPSRQY